jgi:hypothetical protein
VLDPVDFGEQGRVGVAQGPFFQILGLVGQVVEHHEVAVDERVEERIGQIVAAVAAHGTVFGAQAFADGFEVAGGALLEGQHEISAEDDTDLVGVEAAVRGVEVEAAGNDVDVVREFVALRDAAGC